MKVDALGTTSPWTEGISAPSYSPLLEDLDVEVCIVGGGVVGLSIAYQLVCQGKSVIVLEGGTVGGGETKRSTAHLTYIISTRYSQLESWHGPGKTALVAGSHVAALDEIERICQEEKIDCDFVRLPCYIFCSSKDYEKTLQVEREAALRLGIGQSSCAELWGLEGRPQGLCFPAQGQLHPLKYVYGLAEAITQRGGKIFEMSPASKFRSGRPCAITSQMGHTVRAETLIVATHSPVNDLGVIHFKQIPYRTYVIGARVPKGSLASGIYWDIADPYHYVRMADYGAAKRDDKELLMIGGQNHKVGAPPVSSDPYRSLLQWAQQRFSFLEEIEYRWSGQIFHTFDGLPFIGCNPMDTDNVFVATGGAGHGLMHGTIAGMMIPYLMNKQSHPWKDLYDPGRKPLKAFTTYAGHHFAVAGHYSGYFKAGDVVDVKQISPGSGGVLRKGLGKVAVYRDGEGNLHTYSAICTHLGCLVAWNKEESSWDCPCHGSRYDCYGRVINGPAKHDLKRI